jgi:sulfopyruvate decarboxylase subunit beta
MEVVGMMKTHAIKVVLDSAGTAPVILTTGFACRMAHALGCRSESLYMTGSMGLAGAIGAGLASTIRRPVFVVDGDGSLLMNVSVLCTIGAMPDLPLTHVVLDDGRYASTGGQPTLSHRHDFAALATAAGYLVALSTAEHGELAAAVAYRACVKRGPALIHCRLSVQPEDPGPRITGDLREHAVQFRRAVLHKEIA